MFYTPLLQGSYSLVALSSGNLGRLTEPLIPDRTQLTSLPVPNSAQGAPAPSPQPTGPPADPAQTLTSTRPHNAPIETSLLVVSSSCTLYYFPLHSLRSFLPLLAHSRLRQYQCVSCGEQWTPVCRPVWVCCMLYVPTAPIRRFTRSANTGALIRGRLCVRDRTPCIL